MRGNSAGGGGATSATGAFSKLDGTGAGAAPAFDSHDLKVHGAEIHAGLCPCVKVVGNRDSTAGAAALADGDVLVKGRGALNRRLIDLLVLPDLIRGTVAGDGTFLCARFWVPN